MVKEGVLIIWQEILERIFPEMCLGCESPDTFLCSLCRSTCQTIFSPVGVNRCSVCKEETCFGMTCPSCQVETPLAQLISLTEYHPKTIPGKLIEYVKYHYSVAAVEEITQWIKNSVEVIRPLQAVDIIIPIPLHPRREAERGFNQSQLIAQAVGDILQKPVVTTILKRTKYTKQQATLNRQERLVNLTKAFVCHNEVLLKNCHCLLVDDVFTTGSTLVNAAQTLRNAGADSISAFTLARGHV